MSKILTFYGASDDLCEVEEVGGPFREEYNCYDKPCIIRLWSKKEKAGLFIIVQYAISNTGTWAVGIAQLDEDISLPNWAMSYTDQTGYSVGLTIECPDDVSLVEENKDEDEEE